MDSLHPQVDSCRAVSACTLLLIAWDFDAVAVAADSIQLPVTNDNSRVLVDGEWDQNAGQKGRIRIRGNPRMVAMAFDTSAIAGKHVTTATVVCVRGEQSISGVTISTIATPWIGHS